ncbi:hypothetical protein V1264_018903 [Littorina saxatilis]|uniref:Major facilitator superfamily (MFS) profile domain-containing protein n=2 Tax=Littorina saxatilis TaxID=31220 RepID=A0AAN9BG54_9CAEN
MEVFNATSSLTSLIMSVQYGVFCVSALVVHNVLLDLIHVRTSALVGGFLMAAGMTLGTFAHSVPFLIFSLGVVVGIGNAMTYGPGLVLLGQYFERRRALAIALANTGSSVGSMTLPLLATHLLQRYGLHGTWLLYGAVTLHLCVFANLYRPLQHNRQTQQQQHGENVEDVEEEDTDKNEQLGEALLKGKASVSKKEMSVLYSDLTNSNVNLTTLPMIQVSPVHERFLTELLSSESLKIGSTELMYDVEEVFLSKPLSYAHGNKHLMHVFEQDQDYKQLLPESSARQFSSSGNMALTQPELTEAKRSATVPDLRPSPLLHQRRGEGSLGLSSESWKQSLKNIALYAGQPHLLVQAPPFLGVEDSKDFSLECLSSDLSDKSGSRSRCRGLLSKLTCEVSLMRNPLFWLVQAYVCVGVVAASGAGAYLPSLCRERGLSGDDTAVVLTSWGAVNLLGRLLTGLLADRRWLRPARLSALAFLVIGSLFQLLPLLPTQSFAAMMSVGVVYGLFEGAYFTLLPIIIIDFVQLKNFSKTFGFVQLSQGASNMIMYPILGKLRDATGDYNATFQCLGACALLASILLFAEPLARALKRPNTKEDSV